MRRKESTEVMEVKYLSKIQQQLKNQLQSKRKNVRKVIENDEQILRNN